MQKRLTFSVVIFLVLILSAAGTARAQGHVTDVAISTDSSSLQSGVCPVTVVFNGYITMDGPGTVTYQIIRSDGGTGPIHSVDFLKPGTYSIRETWTLGDGAALPNYEGWMAIRVLTPHAVESSHADAHFVMTCSGTPPPLQPQRARFRVTLTGFLCRHETRDHLFEADGPGDEVYQAPYVLIVNRIGAPTTWRSGAGGPVFGGIRTGTNFPTATPWVLSGTATGLGVPGVLFEGELIEGERAVAIAPTFWEWDGDHRQLLNFWGACATNRDRLAENVIAIMTGPFPGRYGGTHIPGVEGSINLLGIIREGDVDRPIGMRVWDSGTGSLAFTPQVLLLTYEGAMRAASSASLGLDNYIMNYFDPVGYDGDYSLYLKVEQIP